MKDMKDMKAKPYTLNLFASTRAEYGISLHTLHLHMG